MSYIKTKTGENTITFDAFYQYIWARNYGDTDVYISTHNNIVAGDDDVALLPAGEAVRLTVNGKTLYVLGSTTLEVHAQNFSDSPFAWNEAGEGGGSEVSVVSLSVNENGTYTAPSGTAYSPVTVSVPTGAEIITRSNWNALTTAQKQAKGLVAIQDASTGFKRGEFVNGADYVPANVYIPYSDETKVFAEAYVDNFDATATAWGTGSNPVQYDIKPSINVSENAVSANTANGVVPYVELGANSKPFTAYCVLKAVNPSTYTRLLCCTDAISSNHGITLVGSNIYIASIQSDTPTGVSSSDYFVGCIKYGTNDTAGYVYDAANDNLIKVSKTPAATGSSVVLGRMMLDNTGDQGNLLIRYFAVVDDTESDSVIENNMMNLYRSFISDAV